MKKILMLVLTASVLLINTSCNHEKECTFCGGEKVCEEKEVYGEIWYICEDCLDYISETK